MVEFSAKRSYLVVDQPSSLVDGPMSALSEHFIKLYLERLCNVCVRLDGGAYHDAGCSISIRRRHDRTGWIVVVRGVWL